MAVTLGQNISSLRVQRALGRASAQLSSTSERLSSGMRINRASDDAAGLAIADSLRADAKVFSQAVRNLNDGISLIAIATSATKELTSITQRLMELAEQSANGVYSNKQRIALQKEADALVDEHNRIVKAVTFNGRRVFNDDRSIQIQAGQGAGSSLRLDIGEEMAHGVGDGTFQSSTTIGLNGSRYGVLAGDVDGDGDNDLVYSGGADSIVLINNGNATFSHQQVVSIGTSLGGRLIDLNNDGKLDLVSGRSTDIQVALGNGNGTFKASQSYSGGSGTAYDIDVGDLNGDGILDVVASRYNTPGFVTIFIGNGNGSFRASYSVASNGANPDAVTIGDFTNDGKADMMVANFAGRSAALLVGDGAGGFTLGQTTAFTASYVSKGKAADFDRDGNLDYIFSAFSSNAAAILWGNGDGTFSAAELFAVGTSPNHTEVADMNGDGYLDFLTADRASQNLTLYLGNGDGTFKNRVTVSAGDGAVGGGSPRWLAVADLDGNGSLDVVTGDNTTQSTIVLAKTFTSYDMPHIDISSASRARAALTTVRERQDEILAATASLGAGEKRLDTAKDHLAVMREVFLAAEGRIRDMDAAQETAHFQRLAILQRASAAILGQANLIPSLALQLLNGP